jgi:hypothetical protein
MSNYRTIFQDHHNIEQQTLKNSELLAKLQGAGRFDIHAPENRLLLPATPQLRNPWELRHIVADRLAPTRMECWSA